VETGIGERREGYLALRRGGTPIEQAGVRRRTKARQPMRVEMSDEPDI